MSSLLRRASRFALNLSVSLLSILVLSAILEIGLRLLGYQARGAQQVHRFGPWLGEVPEDSWARELDVSDTTVDVRGQLVPRDKTPGETRIIFIGDSATEGVGVGLQESFPLKFKEELDSSRPGNNVHVINAGAYGMTTIDEYEFLRSKLVQLSPDVVVLGFFVANDITFNLAHRQYTALRHPQSSVEKLLSALRSRSVLFETVYKGFLILNSRYRIAVPGEGKTAYLPLELQLIDEDGFHMLNYLHGEIAAYRRKSSSLVDYAFEVLDRVFASFKGLSAEHDFKFVVLLIPTASVLTDRLLMLPFPKALDLLAEDNLGVEEAELDFGLPTARVLGICKRLRLRCIDPTARMERFGLDVLLPGDDHPSVLGHMVLAQVLAEHYPF